MSAKNAAELKNCLKDLDTQFKKVGKVFTIRWLASTFKTLDAIFDSYAALSKYLLDASQDVERTSSQRASFKGFHSSFTSINFVKNLATMHDVLKELSDLSVLLQERTLSLPRAIELIRLYIVRVESLKESPGDKVIEVSESKKMVTYKEVDLNKRHCKVIKSDDFINAVCDSMKLRLFTTIANSCDEPSAKKRKTDFEQFTNAISILNIDEIDTESFPRYGEKEIKTLAKMFHLNCSTTR